MLLFKCSILMEMLYLLYHLMKVQDSWDLEFYIGEMFIKINGVQNYLWRVVDQDGDVIDVYLYERRDSWVAKRFLSADADEEVIIYSIWDVTWFLLRCGCPICLLF